MLLNGEVAVVTGGASARGIGQAIARLYAEQGAHVAVTDIDGQGAQKLADSLGSVHRGYRCDVTKHSEVEAVFSQIAQELGPVSILVNNAGITQPKGISEITEADYDAVLDVNLRGTFLCSKAVIPNMRRLGRGSIICISSVSAKRGGGIFGGPHYSASKAGILGLTRAMARELAPEGIRVNAIAPGLIDTDITKGKLSDEQKADVLKSIPMGRMGQPIDVARACLFFASSLSEYVTGEVMDVNGGMHID
ncbi:MAG: SDR family oxidoreductase [Deltaproteobacteria bacterium]|nr:SDR family oxidoreductase [Deltaproteobacteria bacterium]